MTREPQKKRAQPRATLLVSLVLAAALGAVTYAVSTSLPYFELSPTSDPQFGQLNACLIAAVPQRLGFAVAPDAQAALAWSADQLAVCTLNQNARVFALNGITAAAFDNHRRVWLARATPDSGEGALLMLADSTFERRGSLRVEALVGTQDGVVLLGADHRLISIDAEGNVGGTFALPATPRSLTRSGDGARIAAQLSDALAVLNSTTLETTFLGAPCAVDTVWWLPQKHSLIASCESESALALRLDVDTGNQEPAERKTRERSTLAGDAAIWVRSCDNLPCSASAP